MNESFATEWYITNKPSIVGMNSIVPGSIRWSSWIGIERERDKREGEAKKKSEWEILYGLKRLFQTPIDFLPLISISIEERKRCILPKDLLHSGQVQGYFLTKFVVEDAGREDSDIGNKSSAMFIIKECVMKKQTNSRKESKN